MLITLLILKLTLDSIVNECNRLVMIEEHREQAQFLKTRIFQLQQEFENGKINEQEYKEKEAEILKQLHDILSKTKVTTSDNNNSDII